MSCFHQPRLTLTRATLWRSSLAPRWSPWDQDEVAEMKVTPTATLLQCLIVLCVRWLLRERRKAARGRFLFVFGAHGTLFQKLSKRLKTGKSSHRTNSLGSGGGGGGGKASTAILFSAHRLPCRCGLFQELRKMLHHLHHLSRWSSSCPEQAPVASSFVRFAWQRATMEPLRSRDTNSVLSFVQGS